MHISFLATLIACVCAYTGPVTGIPAAPLPRLNYPSRAPPSAVQQEPYPTRARRPPPANPSELAEALQLLQVYEQQFTALKQKVLSFIELDELGGAHSVGDSSKTPRSKPSAVPSSFAATADEEALRKKLAEFEKQYRFEQQSVKGEGADTGTAGSSTSQSNGDKLGGVQDNGLFDFPNGGEGFHYVPSQYHHPPPPPLAPPPPPPPPLYGATHLNDFGSLSNFKTKPSSPSFKEVEADVLSSTGAASQPTKDSGGDFAMQGSVLENARKMRFQGIDNLQGTHETRDSADGSTAHTAKLSKGHGGSQQTLSSQ